MADASGELSFTNRYQLGADPYLQVVSAETIELLNERDEVDILRRRMEACVLLFKALGGSWDLPTFQATSSQLHALIITLRDLMPTRRRATFVSTQ